MKEINCKDLLGADVVRNALNFFSKEKNVELGFYVIKSVYNDPGIVEEVNKFRRSYAVAQALEKSDNEEQFLRRCLNDSYNSAFLKAKTLIKEVIALNAYETATLERFLENLAPDVYDETGSRQTLID